MFSVSFKCNIALSVTKINLHIQVFKYVGQRGIWSISNIPVEECIFDNMALYFERRFNKNALLQTVFFLAILPHWDATREFPFCYTREIDC